MKNKLDCEKSSREKYWEDFLRLNQNGIVGMFQRFILKKKKEKKNEISK